MFCKFCGAELADKSMFCKKCGHMLQDGSNTPVQEKSAGEEGQFCPACGQRNKVGVRFCKKCGRDFSTAKKEQEEKLRIEEERARKEAEQAQREAEEQVRKAREEQERLEREERERQERLAAEEKIRRETEEKLRLEYEDKLRIEAEERVQKETVTEAPEKKRVSKVLLAAGAFAVLLVIILLIVLISNKKREGVEGTETTAAITEETVIEPEATSEIQTIPETATAAADVTKETTVAVTVETKATTAAVAETKEMTAAVETESVPKGTEKDTAAGNNQLLTDLQNAVYANKTSGNIVGEIELLDPIIVPQGSFINNSEIRYLARVGLDNGHTRYFISYTVPTAGKILFFNPENGDIFMYHSNSNQLTGVAACDIPNKNLEKAEGITVMVTQDDKNRTHAFLPLEGGGEVTEETAAAVAVVAGTEEESTIPELKNALYINKTDGKISGDAEVLSARISFEGSYQDNAVIGPLSRVALNNGYYRYYIPYSVPSIKAISFFNPPNGTVFMHYLSKVTQLSGVAACDISAEDLAKAGEITVQIREDDSNRGFAWMRLN